MTWPIDKPCYNCEREGEMIACGFCIAENPPKHSGNTYRNYKKKEEKKPCK